MFGGLRKWLEEATAQVNPFDGGKTASTVRAARNIPPAQTTRIPRQAQTVQQATQQVRRPGFSTGIERNVNQGLDRGLSWEQIAKDNQVDLNSVRDFSKNTRPDYGIEKAPSYGTGVTGVVNRYKDVLDANTPQDYFKRNQEVKTNWKAPLLPPKQDQTYTEQQIDLGNKRPYQNVGAAIAGSTARLLNTGEQARQEVMDTTRLYGAQARGDSEDWRNTNTRIKARQQKAYQPNSGLLGQGTIFDKPEDFNTMGAGEITKRVASTTAGAGLEIAPLSKGAGITTKLLSKAPNVVARGAMRAGAGFAEGTTQDVLEQQINRDNFSPAQALASGAFGGVLANAGPMAGAVVNKAKPVTTKLVQNRAPLNEIGAVGRNVDEPTPRVPDPLESLKQEADTGKVFYHGTSNKDLKSLADLQAGSKVGKSGRNRTYVTENPEIAKNFGENVIEERLYGKHLNVKDIGVERTPGWAQDNVVAPEFADYKTTKLLTEREKRVFENQFVKGVPNNTIIEDTPGIHKYLASKGYTTVTVPRTISDVDGVRSETIIIDKKAFQAPTQSQPPKTVAPVESKDVAPKGFIIKETKPRGGRKDTIRISRDPATGKMRSTIQTEDVPQLESRDPYIKEYADMLRDQESGRKGGQLVDTADGKKRVTEHSPFYREHFKQNKRAPTKYDYYLEAERQVKEGKADPGFMEYYNSVNKNRTDSGQRVLENKIPSRMSESEWQVLMKQASKEAPKTKKAVHAVTKDLKEQQVRAVSKGDIEQSQAIRSKIGEIEQGLKRTPPDLSKTAEDTIGQIEPKDIKGRANKDIKKRFMARANEYLGERRALNYRSVDEARKFNEQFGDLSDAQKLEVIRATDDPTARVINPRVQQAVDSLHAQYDQAYRYFTKDRGIKMGYQHSYYPRMYKHPTTGELISGAEFNLLQRASSRQKGRTSDIIAEDFLVTKDPAEALQRYHTSLEEAATGKRFLNDLEKEGLVISSSEPVRGMRPVVAEGMQEPGTIFYAKPEVAKSLDRMFGTQEASGIFEKLVEKGQGLNSFMQSVVLSGGIPNTPVNAFGFMQVMKETMAGHPLVAGKAFFRSLGRSQTDQFFKKNSSTLQEMANHGLDIRIDYQAKYRNMFGRIKDTADNKGTKATMTEAWDQFTNDATFQRFMPLMETMHYKHLRDGLVKRGMAPDVAAKRSANATRNFFGKTELAKQAVRSKTGQDFVGATLFAPRFRESMINFWGRNVKALDPRQFGKVEYRSNQMFLVSAAATWASMEGINHALNGNFMYDNPDGKKDKLLIPDKYVPFNTNGKDLGIPFLSSVATVPRNAVALGLNAATGNFSEAAKNLKSFASMPLNTAMSIGTNEDYFGNKIVDDNVSPVQKFTQAGSYIARSNMQPWVREGLNLAGQKLPEGTKTTLGIKKKSLYETVSNALEAPTRFYDPKYYRYGDSWTPRGGKDEKFTITQQRERADVKKEIDSISSRLGLNKRQKADYDSLSAVEFNQDGSIKEDNNPFYKAQRYSKLQDDGVFEAMKQKAELNAKLNGKPVDPIYGLDGEARRVVLWKKTLPQGTSDPTVKKLYEQDWYQDYRSQEDEYFNSKKKWNKKMGYADSKQDTNPFPEAPKEVSKAQDYYFTLPKGTGARSSFIRNNPGVWNKLTSYWQQKDNWTNGERAQVGLGEIDDKSTTTGYSKSGKGGRKGSGSKGSARGSKKGSKYDWTKDMFGTAKTSTSVSKQLRKILAEAEIKAPKKA